MSSITKNLPTLKLGPCTILFDTGSSINFIHPNLVQKNNLKTYEEKLTFKTVNGKSNCSHYTFIKINKNLLKCYIFNFHKIYNILLGIEAFQKLNKQINFKNNEVQIGNDKYKLCDIKKSKVEVNNVQIRNNHLNELERF